MTEFQLEKVQKLTVDQMGRLKRTSAFEMGRRSATAALSCFAALGVLAFMSPYASEYPKLIYSAFVLFIFTYLTSLGLVQRFEAIYDASPRLWHLLKSTAVVVTAATWGVVSAMAIYLYPDSWISLLAAVITVAMCAGGMYSLGMKLTLLDSFLVAMLLPNIIVGLTIGGTSGMVLGFIFFVYLGYCSAQGRNIYREYWEARINTELLSEETKRQLHNLTYQDKLTGLPNRALFLDRLNQAALEAKRAGHFVGLLILGLDRFKKINDTLGYQSGDEILNVVAYRLRDCVRESDTVARLGGDIFAIVLPDPSDDHGLARLAQKILNRLVQPVEAKGLE
ncbi:MAG: diguanylate cyclase domain-containing protein, partial [Acidiferrobacterales bacterium]